MHSGLEISGHACKRARGFNWSREQSCRVICEHFCGDGVEHMKMMDVRWCGRACGRESTNGLGGQGINRYRIETSAAAVYRYLPLTGTRTRSFIKLGQGPSLVRQQLASLSVFVPLSAHAARPVCTTLPPPLRSECLLRTATLRFAPAPIPANLRGLFSPSPTPSLLQPRSLPSPLHLSTSHGPNKRHRGLPPRQPEPIRRPWASRSHQRPESLGRHQGADKQD